MRTLATQLPQDYHTVVCIIIGYRPQIILQHLLKNGKPQQTAEQTDSLDGK